MRVQLPATTPVLTRPEVLERLVIVLPPALPLDKEAEGRQLAHTQQRLDHRQLSGQDERSRSSGKKQVIRVLCQRVERWSHTVAPTLMFQGLAYEHIYDRPVLLLKWPMSSLSACEPPSRSCMLCTA